MIKRRTSKTKQNEFFEMWSIAAQRQTTKQWVFFIVSRELVYRCWYLNHGITRMQIKDALMFAMHRQCKYANGCNRFLFRGVVHSTLFISLQWNAAHTECQDRFFFLSFPSFYFYCGLTGCIYTNYTENDLQLCCCYNSSQLRSEANDVKHSFCSYKVCLSQLSAIIFSLIDSNVMVIYYSAFIRSSLTLGTTRNCSVWLRRHRRRYCCRCSVDWFNFPNGVFFI